MAPERGTAAHVAAILNCAYMVRHYPRPGQRALRAAAIAALGRACREAFNASEDYEPVLRAIVDGLAPRDDARF